jgi:hypothetical protein
MTRKHLTTTRIFLSKVGHIEIQHHVKFPASTLWWPTAEDILADDYVPAYFNSDTTQPLN